MKIALVSACVVACLTLTQAAAEDTKAADISGIDLQIPAKEHPVTAIFFPAPGAAKRPAVMMLHGGGGWAPQIDSAKHYASELAKAGFDVYMLSYYTEEDEAGRQAGEDVFQERFTAWAHLVDDAADWTLKQKNSNGRVGLLGFSNGGILTAGAGSIDTNIKAGVVYYGAVPSALEETIKKVPPLLILHGDADKVIPVRAAYELQAVATKLKSPPEIKIYPGEGHGFGGDLSKPNAQDAFQRAVAFLKPKLQTK